jgi:ribosomal protein L44E
MSHHYTKNSVEASHWCNVCRKETMHRIDDGRLGPCQELHQKPQVEKPKPEQKQQTFWGDR